MAEQNQSAAAVDMPVEVDELALTLLIAPPAAIKSNPIRLEQVSPADTVLSLRQLIAEYPDLAGYTCYRLEVQDPETSSR